MRGAGIAVEIVGETITDVRLLGSPAVYDGLRLIGSTFKHCLLAQFDDPGFGLEVRNATLERCRVQACEAQGVFFEEVTIDALRTTRLHQILGCIFKHVTLRGDIGPIMAVGPHPTMPNKSEYIARAIEKYKDIDWALDISEAVFTDTAEFFFVPGELIRRDENTQALLRRNSFDGVDWRELPGHVRTWVRRFSSTPFDSIIAIAPKGSREFCEYMEDIEWLHDNGLAE